MKNSILKNVVFNVFNKTLSVVFPLITISYVSRILGPAGIGKVASAQNIVSYFVMFASLGIPAYGVRVIAQTKQDRKVCNENFTELFMINMLSTLVCLALYFFLIFNITNSHEAMGLNIIFSTILMFNIFNIEWVYQAFEEFGFIAVRSCIVKMTSIAMLFLFCREADDVIAYGIIVCLGTVGNYLLNMINVFKYVRFDFESICLNKHFRPIFVFFASVIAIELYSLVDVTMLTYMTNAEEVGYYTNAVKIVKTISGMFTAIGAVMMPRLSVLFAEKAYKEIDILMSRVTKVITLLTIPGCVGIMLTANRLVPILFGTGFEPAISTVKILSILIIFMPISGGITAQILQSSGRERFLFLGVLFGAITNIALNAVFISMWGRNGAAIASVITEIIVTGITMFYCGPVAKIKLEFSYWISVCISTGAMILFVVLSERWMKDVQGIVTFVFQIFIGVIVYFLALVLSKNKDIYFIIEKIREKARRSTKSN